MLDLTMPPLHHHQQQQQFFPSSEHPHEVEHSTSHPQQQQQQQQVPTFVRAEAVALAATDCRKKQRLSQPVVASPPWQRMKWTDGMVRLLIMVVYCIGDDGYGGTTEDSAAGKGKKGTTSATSAALPLQQKKGKWKSVSNAMMEKGFYVSPQQCEDKFNDLNKRYKRVIDLVGKGTACRVVENHSLLDTMDHLSRKAKEETRKLLNSKHLFFPEMCAYHNGGSTAACSSSVAGSPLQPHLPQPDNEDNIDDEDDEDSDDEYDDDEGPVLKHKNKHRGEDDKEQLAGLKMSTSSSMSASPSLSLSLSASPEKSTTSMQQLRSGLMESLATVGGEQEQRNWLWTKVAELEKRSLGYRHRAFEIEQQRYKWLRFSSNKEREIERMKLRNDRVCLENDSMLLLLRQKQYELVNVNGTTS